VKVIAVVASAVIVLGMQNKTLQLGQSYGSSNGGSAATAANSTISAGPNQSTNKDFNR
jgi:hypothetical protein